ncbi:MAG: PTS sugar transporter subunit IIA [Deltaproteobacteria bacterium]|nr:PTS sugar transporter subunit IIA [Deltaproteobacteria bacterium]
MKVSDILRVENIVAGLFSSDKRGALAELSGHLAGTVPGIDEAYLLGCVLERERLGSTGIGHGVALPHAKVRGLDSLCIVLGRSRQGIDFQAADGAPVHLIFLVAAPENSTAVILKALSSLSRLLKEPGVMEGLIKADSAAAMRQFIAEAEVKLFKSAAL